MSDIEAGKTVQLLSGGPVMTVEDQPNPEHVVCIWFANDELQRNSFATVTLKPCEPPQPQGFRSGRTTR